MVSNCPRGLENLTAIDQLFIKEMIELVELFLGYEKNNKYEVKNSMGQNIYFAVEESSVMRRLCFDKMRPFDIKILDKSQNEVLHLYRPLRCVGCCFPRCMQILEVSSPPGTIIGTVKEKWSLWKPKFVIENAAGDSVLRIVGPICPIHFCCDVNFLIYTMDGKRIGKISKKWSIAREIFTDVDYFGVSFPLDLDVRMKALIFAAAFLISFMFYEE